MRDLLNKQLAKVGLYWKAWDEVTPFWQGYVIGMGKVIPLCIGAAIAWYFLR